MYYLSFIPKTQNNDGEFKGIIMASSASEAKKIAKKLNVIVFAATNAEIHFMKNDAKIRVSKTNSLPADFDLKTAPKLN